MKDTMGKTTKQSKKRVTDELKQTRREKNVIKELKTFSDEFMENGREQPRY